MHPRRRVIGRWVAVMGALALWAASAGSAGAQVGGVDLAIEATPASFVSWSASLVRVNVELVNQGTEAAAGASVTFTPPLGVTLVAASIATRPCDAAAADGSVRCSLSELGAGVRTAASVTAVNTGLPAGSDVTLQVALGSAAADVDPTNNTALVALLYGGGAIPTQPGVPTAQLIFGEPTIGTTETFGIVSVDVRLGNAGPADATGVRVVFGLSAGLTPLQAFISAATAPCPFDAVTRAVTCTLPRPVGAASEEIVHLEVSSDSQPDGAAPTVTITVLADTVDLAPADNTVSVTWPAPSSGERAATPVTVSSDALPFTGRRTEPLLVLGLLALGLGCCLLTPSLRSRR